MKKLVPLFLPLFLLHCQLADTNEKRLAVGKLATEIQLKFPTVPIKTVEDLLAMPPDTYILVDVRSPKEQSVSMLPGAITKEEFLDKGQQFKGKIVITYCTIGYRSSVFAKAIMAQGHNVYNLKGSLLEWAHAGKHFIKDGTPTKKAHVYGKNWDLLPESYQSVK
jgi:rhodanese-related sulfurtransferase